MTEILPDPKEGQGSIIDVGKKGFFLFSIQTIIPIDMEN